MRLLNWVLFILSLPLIIVVTGLGFLGKHVYLSTRWILKQLDWLLK